MLKPESYLLWFGFIIAAGGAATVLHRCVRLLLKSYRCTRDSILHIQQMHEVVVRELMPNHGTSLVDKVARIDSRVEHLETWQQIMNKSGSTDSFQ